MLKFLYFIPAIIIGIFFVYYLFLSFFKAPSLEIYKKKILILRWIAFLNMLDAILRFIFLGYFSFFSLFIVFFLYIPYTKIMRKYKDELLKEQLRELFKEYNRNDSIIETTFREIE